MMSSNSDIYNSDEEIFFGPITEKEKQRIALLQGCKTEASTLHGLNNPVFKESCDSGFSGIVPAVEISHATCPTDKNKTSNEECNQCDVLPAPSSESLDCNVERFTDLITDKLKHNSIQDVDSFEDSLEDKHEKLLSDPKLSAEESKVISPGKSSVILIDVNTKYTHCTPDDSKLSSEERCGVTSKSCTSQKKLNDFKNSIMKSNFECKENIPVSNETCIINKDTSNQDEKACRIFSSVKPPNTYPKKYNSSMKIPVLQSKPSRLISPKVHVSGRFKLHLSSDTKCNLEIPPPFRTNECQKSSLCKPLFQTPISKCKTALRQQCEIASPVAKYINDRPAPPLIQTVKPRKNASALDNAAKKPAIYLQKIWKVKETESNNPVLPVAKYCTKPLEKVGKSPGRCKIGTVAKSTPPSVVRHIGSSKVIPGCDYLASEKSLLIPSPNVIKQKHYENQKAALQQANLETSVMLCTDAIRTNTILTSHMKH